MIYYANLQLNSFVRTDEGHFVGMFPEIYRDGDNNDVSYGIEFLMAFSPKRKS